MSLTSLLAIAAASAAPWSQPAPLATCPANGPAQVVFPSDSPQHATGPGAIVWPASPACSGGEGARVAPLSSGDVPGAAVLPRTAAGEPIVPRGQLAVSAGPHGQIVIAGASPLSTSHGLLIEGAAGRPFSALANLEGAPAPLALATGYLGDLALASPPGSGGQGAAGPSVRVERFFSDRLQARATADAGVGSSGTGPLSAVTLALDYRSDALAVWAQNGALYAHDLPASGTSHTTQRLGGAGSRLRLSALLSDDNRAIVAWSENERDRTSVYIDRSGAGVRFGAPTLLERFRDPDGLVPPSGSPRLVRLSSESVIIAWAGVADGHWVVRTAAIDLRGVGNIATIAATNGGDALLDDLAPGPHDDALVLWSEPSQPAAGPPQVRSQAIFSARGVDVRPDRTQFGAPELLTPAGPNSDPTLALDPASGSAVAVWRGEDDIPRYAIRGALPSVP